MDALNGITREELSIKIQNSLVCDDVAEFLDGLKYRFLWKERYGAEYPLVNNGKD